MAVVGVRSQGCGVRRFKFALRPDASNPNLRPGFVVTALILGIGGATERGYKINKYERDL